MSEYTLRELQKISREGQDVYKTQYRGIFSIKNLETTIRGFEEKLSYMIGVLESLPELQSTLISDVKQELHRLKVSYENTKHLYFSIMNHTKELNMYIEESEQDVYQALNNETMFTDVLPWDMKDDGI